MITPESSALIKPREPDSGVGMHDLAKRLWPICRSLSGNGVRQTFEILQEHIPLEVKELASGTRCFDWTIPEEWNVREAWIKDSSGRRVVDFNKDNLHLMGYSEPFHGTLDLASLKPHVYTLPDLPDAIPYVTSYYSRRWGFCMRHRDFLELPEGDYEVFIDSTLEPGAMTYGDLVIPGRSPQEVLLSTYICHPSLANNEISGPVLATWLAKYLIALEDRRFSYRIVFVPETIGAIAYLSLHREAMAHNTVAGYVLTCVGDEGPFTYLQSRWEDRLVDRLTRHVLEQSGMPFELRSYLQRGSDERQYCWPGIDLPVGSLMKTMYGEFPQYHTSLDDLEFVTPKGLASSFEMYRTCLDVLEANETLTVTTLCEPQLGKRGLYPSVSTRDTIQQVQTMSNLLAYADGTRDLVAIAERIGVSVLDLMPLVRTLKSHGLLTPAEGEKI